MMKLHVALKVGEITVNETVEGESAEAVVAALQQRVAQQSPFLVAAVIKRMNPLAFAQEATRRYNLATNGNMPMPATCDEFLNRAVEKKFATLLEP